VAGHTASAAAEAVRDYRTGRRSRPIIRNDGVGGSNPSCGTIELFDIADLSQIHSLETGRVRTDRSSGQTWGQRDRGASPHIGVRMQQRLVAEMLRRRQCGVDDRLAIGLSGAVSQCFLPSSFGIPPLGDPSGDGRGRLDARHAAAGNRFPASASENPATACALGPMA
jgi:hypothetical protein